jgi:hypothetical protein
MNFYEFLWISRLVSLILEWILVPRFQGDSHTANSSPVEADALLFGPLPLGTNMTNWPTNQEVCQWNPCWLWRWVYLPASIRFHTKVYALQLRKGTPLTQALRHPSAMKPSLRSLSMAQFPAGCVTGNYRKYWLGFEHACEKFQKIQKPTHNSHYTHIHTDRSDRDRGACTETNAHWQSGTNR